MSQLELAQRLEELPADALEHSFSDMLASHIPHPEVAEMLRRSAKDFSDHVKGALDIALDSWKRKA